MILLDMDMPKSCSECELLSEEVWCTITGTSVWQNGIDYNKERLPDCPIIYGVRNEERLFDKFMESQGFDITFDVQGKK